MISRCPICPCTSRPVPGDGPEPCDILFIGERPGREEMKLGRPFIGTSGRELNENYLWLAGLRREDIRLTNTVKCGEANNRKPTSKEIFGFTDKSGRVWEGCAEHHLREEIRRADPSLIVLLGGTACSLVGDIDLDIEHGIPRSASLLGWEGIVVPMYHPAAGLHDTGKMIPLLEDFERLKLVLAGEWGWPEDPYPNPDYRILGNARELRTKIWDYSAPFTAIDTERHGETAFSVQFSQRPGTGYMLLASKPQLVIHRLAGESQPSPGDPLWVLKVLLADYDGEVVLHNAGQDLDWLDKMGIKVNRFRDTMAEAYHLANLPQGLKALAYRLFGIRMRTYEDVVKPWSRDLMTEWLLTALDHLENTRQRTEYKQLKTKVKTIVKPCPLQGDIKRIYRYTLENLDYDPWKKLAELDKSDPDLAEDWASVESTFGQPPIVGIGNVPLPEAVRYGCADADITLRVALELERRRKAGMEEGGEMRISEEDRDV